MSQAEDDEAIHIGKGNEEPGKEKETANAWVSLLGHAPKY